MLPFFETCYALLYGENVIHCFGKFRFELQSQLVFLEYLNGGVHICSVVAYSARHHYSRLCNVACRLQFRRGAMWMRDPRDINANRVGFFFIIYKP